METVKSLLGTIVDTSIGLTMWKLLPSEARSKPYQITLTPDDMHAMLKNHNITSVSNNDGSITVILAPKED